MSVVDVQRGDGPVILGVPHAGMQLTDATHDALNARGRALADTDFHVDRLYDGLLPTATMVRARYSRYVIDLNRDPAGESLYPGRHTTALCPLTDFDGAPIYAPGREPTPEDVMALIAAFHRPYHAALEAEIVRVKARHGVALLYDCHSIRSEIPFLFEGVLPHFSIGDSDGATCAPEVRAAVETVARRAEGYETVVNGRFRGGWTTRRYGRPQDGVHAIQMELAQRAYLAAEAPPYSYDDAKASRLRSRLRAMLEALEALAPALPRP